MLKSSNIIYSSRIHKIFSLIYSGIGHVLMFHRVHPENDHPISRDITVSPKYLEETIKFFISKKIDVVSLDEAHRRLISSKREKRFACFTFDDGYLDNYTHALPIFEKYNLPFAVYVISNFPDRKAVMWWYLLEDMVLSKSKIKFTINSKEHTFICNSENEKKSVFKLVRNIILDSTSSSDLKKRLEAIFTPYGYDLYKLTDKLAMSWKQVKEMANHPLVTIGSHTKSHIALRKLSEKEATREIIECSKLIKEKTGRKINHFAYPFGSPNEADEREFKLLKVLGYKTAFTTRGGNVFKKHKNHLTSMPRIDTRESLTPQKLDFFISGLTPFLKRKGKRIITK